MLKQKRLEFKRGDTFSLVGPLSIPNLADNSFVDLSTWTARAQIRDCHNNLLSELTVNIGEKQTYSNQYVISISCDAINTKDWILGEAKIDIQFTSQLGIVTSSPTFYIEIIDDVTK